MIKTNLILLFLLTFLMPSFGQNIKNGYTKFYFPDGSISSEGTMHNGKPDGYWISYYPTGVIKSEGLRRNFLLDSTWTFYDQTGNVVQKIDYKYDKRNGYTNNYTNELSSEPVLISKELYLNDKKEGLSYTFYKDGNIKEEIPYKDGKREGKGREFDEHGNVITLVEYHNNYIINREKVNRKDEDGFKQGSWIEFYKDGRTYKEMYYKDNKLEGVYKEYKPNGTVALNMRYENGAIAVDDEEEMLKQSQLEIKREFSDDGKLTFQGSYKKGTPVGIHRYYDMEGKVINAKIYDDFGRLVSEGIVDNKGEKHGKWKDFYYTGEVRANGNYMNNMRSGMWSFYYKDGKIEQEGSYLRGLPDGLWTWYYDTGEILREENYFNGREDGEMKEYDKEGNVITQGGFINGEKEGEWIHKVGDNYEKGKYQVGLREGKWYFYYPDDVLHFEGNFTQGRENGKHKYYYPNGNLKEERYFEMGLKEKLWKKYDEKGNLKLTVNYKHDVEYRINGKKINLPRGSSTVIK